jgi:hypothetical protein
MDHSPSRHGEDRGSFSPGLEVTADNRRPGWRMHRCETRNARAAPVSVRDVVRNLYGAGKTAGLRTMVRWHVHCSLFARSISIPCFSSLDRLRFWQQHRAGVAWRWYFGNQSLFSDPRNGGFVPPTGSSASWISPAPTGQEQTSRCPAESVIAAGAHTVSYFRRDYRRHIPILCATSCSACACWRFRRFVLIVPTPKVRKTWTAGMPPDPAYRASPAFRSEGRSTKVGAGPQPCPRGARVHWPTQATTDGGLEIPGVLTKPGSV